jgi:2'-5' RNA ligase
MQRVFLGIPVDKPAQRQINQLLNPVQRSTAGVSWVPENNRHLTLAFLGNRTSAEIESLVSSMAGAYDGKKSFRTGVATLTRFPKPSGSIVALEFEADAGLVQLFQVTQRLLDSNRLDTELKSYRPHVTLGRIRGKTNLETGFYQQTNIHLQVDKINLYQSTLSDAGRVYPSLESIKLG